MLSGTLATFKAIGLCLLLAFCTVGHIVTMALGRLTGFTNPLIAIASFSKTRILRAVNVPLRAMCFIGIGISPSKVFTASNWFHVIRFDAYTIGTQMVYIKVLWNLPFIQFIRQPMSRYFASFASLVVNSQRPVAFLGDISSPIQTRSQVRTC